jgi:hypothetical protein
LISSYLARPSLPESIASPNGFFRIHYNTSGPEAVPPEDLDGDLVPDYVERIALYCDSSYSAYVDHMGYLPPPTDGSTGGDDLYDIYILSIAAYGVTVPEAAADSDWNDYSSFIQVHCNFYGFSENDDPAGDTIGAQKVTCAHEFFHAVQMAYDRNEELWWMEASAVWMEEVVFPEVNDNFIYLPYFFNEPELKLNDGTFHMYGSFVWPAYLQQRYGVPILKSVWEACRYNNGFTAIDSGLAEYGQLLKYAFSEFARWNYYTDIYADPIKSYLEGNRYPIINYDFVYATLAHDSLTAANPPQGLGSNYWQFTIDPSTQGILEVFLDAPNYINWSASLIVEDGSTDTFITAYSLLTAPARIYLNHIGDYEQASVVVANLSKNTPAINYKLSTIVHPYGDANKDRVLNVSDAIYLVDHIFKGGAAPSPWYFGDADCNGSVSVADAVLIINHIFKGGVEPCAGR